MQGINGGMMADAVGAQLHSDCFLRFLLIFYDEKALDFVYGTEDGRTIEQQYCLLLAPSTCQYVHIPVYNMYLNIVLCLY